MKREAIAALALPIAACSGGSPIQAGMWQVTTKLKAGQTELWESKVERCITAAEADDPGLSILSGTPLGQCATGQSRYSGGTLSVVGSCLGRMHPMATSATSTSITLNGRYSATSIDGEFSATIATESQASPQSGTMTARRTGDCPVS